jgi:hypothetical protein
MKRERTAFSRRCPRRGCLPAAHPLFVLSAHTGVRITGQYTLDAWVRPTEIVGPFHDSYGATAAVFFHSLFRNGPEPMVELKFGGPLFHRPMAGTQHVRVD